MINWHDIEDLTSEAEQITVLAQTVEDAMNYGPSTPDAYFGALSLLTSLTHTHAEKLELLFKTEMCVSRKANEDGEENPKKRI